MAHIKVAAGPKGHFLLGSLPQYLEDTLGFFTRCARDYGDVARFRLGTLPCYVFNHPAQIEEVLRTHSPNFIKDRPLQDSRVLGRGLLTSEGDLWRRQRRLIQPAFLHQQVQGYGEMMVASAVRRLETWREASVRDIHEDLTRLALDIAAQALFHADLAGEAQEIAAILPALFDHFLKPLSWTRLGKRLPTPSNLRFWRTVRRLDEVISGLIRRRQLSTHAPGDLISQLLAVQHEDGSRMTDRQLRDEVVTLLLAGHETTALALSYSFDLLARHPEAEARLATELEEVLTGRTPTVADLPRLRYAEWVIKEALRLYPPAWGLGREAVTDCEIGGYRIRKGTQVLMIPWVVHRDSRWFSDPEAFQPERWAEDLEKRLPRCAYFPFGHGPRICLGQHFALLEAVLVLAIVAQRYRLTLLSDQPLELIPSITLRPRHGIKMMVHTRQAVGSWA